MCLCKNCPKQQNSKNLCSLFNNTGTVPPYHLPLKSILKNRYCIGPAIGEGSFGITYTGYDTRLDIKTAVKECFPKEFICRNTDMPSGNRICLLENTVKSDYQDILNNFYDEARTLAYLSREINLSGIVSVSDYFMENDTAYMVMDFIKGQNLNEYAQSKDGRLSVKETLKLMYPAGQTIARLHRHETLHRDISPENIMINLSGETFQTVLIDFGASREFYNHNKNNDICNRDYSPLEQLQSAEQGPYTDVYAYCASIYRLITGQSPKTNGLITPSRLGIRINPAIQKALMRGLERSSSKRYQTMDALLTDLYQKPFRRKIIQTAVISALAVSGILYFIVAASKKTPVTSSVTPELSVSDASYDTSAILPEQKSPVLNPYTNEQGILELNLSDLELTDLNFFAAYDPHDLSGIKSVNLSKNRLCDISGLKYLTGLTNIDLSYNDDLQDIQPLSVLKKLRILDLSSNTSIRDFSVLNDLTDLESLILYAVKISNIDFAANLPKLKNLNLENCLNLSKISIVRQLKNLESLNISSCNDSVWQSLPKMNQLKSLFADDYSFNSQFDFTAFPSLETLSISNTDVNLNQLHSLPNLKNLFIYNMQYGLENLEALKKLEKLGVSSIPANMPFESLAGLKELDICCIKKTNLDLNRLSVLTHLETLTISGDEPISIHSLNPLKSLPLETLDLQIKSDEQLDYTPLSGLYDLKNLRIHKFKSFSGNSEKELDLQFLEPLKYLETLDLNIGTCKNYDTIKNLVKLTSLKLASLANISDVYFLADLKRLTELELKDIEAADFQAIAELSNLKNLYLLNAKILNADFLNSLVSLEALSIQNTRISTSLKNLDFIKNLPCLLAFSIDGVQINNISGLSDASSLISLHIDSCGKEKPLNLDMLSSLPGISSLSLSNMIIEDITPLSKLKYLSFLNLDECSFSQNCFFESSGFNNLKNISAKGACLPSIQWLANAADLRIADITTASVRDLTALSSCLSLHTLCADNMDQLQTLEGLQNMKNLHTLNLNHCILLSDLQALNSITNLENLSLDGLKSSDLSDLKNLTRLKFLSCAKSDVSDLSALSSLKELEILNLDSAPAKDLSPLSACSRLEYLYLNYTQTDTVSDLKNLPLELLSICGTHIPELYKELSQFTSQNLLLNYDKQMLTKKQKKKLQKNFPDWNFY